MISFVNVQECTKHESGRLVIPLLFKQTSPSFPGIHYPAIQRFYSSEKSLLKKPTLYDLYTAFMREYLELGLMEVVIDPTPSSSSYYIPHHCSLKPNCLTINLRVVFYVSAKLPSHSSLNDSSLIGPKLQQDIVTILLNFRLHPFLFTTDIKMMYSQILVALKYQDY